MNGCVAHAVAPAHRTRLLNWRRGAWLSKQAGFSGGGGRGRALSVDRHVGEGSKEVVRDMGQPPPPLSNLRVCMRPPQTPNALSIGAARNRAADRNE